MLKALIIRPGALGDTLMLVPALKAVETGPRVTVAAREPGLTFLKLTGAEGIDVEGQGWHRLFQEKPDLHFQIPVPPKDVVVAYLNDADGRIARNLKAYFPRATIHVLAAYPDMKDETHVARYICETLTRFGLPIDPAAAMERAGNGALLKAGRNTAPERRIVVHPGSGSSRKNLPPEFWTSFLGKIVQEPPVEGKKDVVLLGPAEEGMRNFFGKWVSRSAEVVFCPRSEQLASLLEHASLYAGHDSGITHLAAMLGTPTVAVFRENTVSRWHPLGPYTRVIRCRKADEACLEQLLAVASVLLARGFLTEQRMEASRTPGEQMESNSNKVRRI